MRTGFWASKPVTERLRCIRVEVIDATVSDMVLGARWGGAVPSAFQSVSATNTNALATVGLSVFLRCLHLPLSYNLHGVPVRSCLIQRDQS